MNGAAKPVRNVVPEVSAIDSLGNWFQRHVLPVQSIVQFSWLCGLIAALIALIFGLDKMLGYTESSRQWFMIVLAGVVGTFPSYMSVLPERFIVRVAESRKRAAVRALLLECANRMGYEETASLGQETVLRIPRSKLLVWREHVVYICERDDEIEVRGAKNAIRRLHKRTVEALSP